jgi:hypothetical protein
MLESSSSSHVFHCTPRFNLELGELISDKAVERNALKSSSQPLS